jgi:predicted ATP-dependent endonuclease of OLD family
MTIEKVIIENFKGVKKITTSLKSGVFYVCGKNESGKTSFLEGIMFALMGKKAFAKGKWKEITGTAEGKTMTSCVLVDDAGNEILKVERKVSGDNETVTITRPDGHKFTQADLDQIIEPIALNPKAFMEMTPQEQAIFVGIDTSDIDFKYKQVYQDRQDIGRDVKRLKGSMENNFCQKPEGNFDVQKLNDELRKSGNENIELNNNLDKIDEITIQVRDYEQKIIDLKKKKVELENLTAGKTIINLASIEARIREANETAGLTAKYQLYIQSKTEYEKAEAEYEAKTALLETIKQDKIDLINKTDLPFSNLVTDETGGLMVKKDGQLMPFNSDFFSTGKMWEMSIKLLSSRDKELKTIIIKEASLLDDEKLNSIIKTANEKGLQVLLEMVGEVEGENSITLVEGELK